METQKIEELRTPQLLEEKGAEQTGLDCSNCDAAEVEEKLRGIWQKQLVKREDRIVHGHFEGELAHKLGTIAIAFNS